jgi:hypothetical protein
MPQAGEFSPPFSAKMVRRVLQAVRKIVRLR